VFVLPAAGNILTGVTINTVAGSFDEAARNTVVTPLSAVPSPANGGPAAWNQLGVSRVGTGGTIRDIAARYAWALATDAAGTDKARLTAADTLYADGLIRVNADLSWAAISVRYYLVGSGTVYTIMDGVHYDLVKDTLVSLQTINGGNLPSGSLAGRAVGSYVLELDIAHASLPGEHIFSQSLFAIMDEPATTSVAADDTTGGVAGAIALSSILPPRGTSDKLYSAAEEAVRHTAADPTKYQLGYSFQQFGAAVNGSLDLAALLAAAQAVGYALGYAAAEALFGAWEAARNTAADATKYALGYNFKQFGATVNGSLDLDTLVDDAYAAGYAAAQALFSAWEAARNTLLDVSKVALDWVYRQFGENRVGTHAGGSAPPDPSTWDGDPVAGDGQISVPILAPTPTSRVYVRVKVRQEVDWEDESEIRSRTGSGNVVVSDDIDNETNYLVTFYTKDGALESEWAGARPCRPTAGGGEAATDNVPVAKRAMKQTAVYWAPSSEADRFGQPVVQTPVQIACRWEEKSDEFVDAEGTTQTSKAVLIVDRDLEVGGVLMQGTLEDVDHPTDPKANDGAEEIRAFNKTPNFKGKKFLRQAYL
jgi:hypothetical protein